MPQDIGSIKSIPVIQSDFGMDHVYIMSPVKVFHQRATIKPLIMRAACVVCLYARAVSRTSGSLVVTNLRVLWIAHKHTRVNLSEFTRVLSSGHGNCPVSKTRKVFVGRFLLDFSQGMKHFLRAILTPFRLGL